MPRIEAVEVFKSFGGIQALQGASFEAGRGEVHALVGENGAGKSTLIKILSGLLQLDRGEIRLPRREPRDSLGFIRRSEVTREAVRLLDGLGLPQISADALVGDLPLAQRQLVEIAKVISRSPAILLLDEPTSALSEREVAWLFELIRRLRGGGLT